MTRRRRVVGGLLIALALLVGSWLRGRAVGPGPRPSVLLITLDTFRADRLRAYGGPAGLTPNLDRLAAAGTVFEEGLASVPLTLPSHTTILTGLEPPRHGVRDNGTYVVPADLPTLATLLRSEGYATGAFVGAHVLDRRFGLHRGFDTYDDRIDRSDDRKSVLEAERQGDEVVTAASIWLRGLPGGRGPFLAWVHLYDAHAPYAAPAAFRAAHPERPYDAEVAYVDDSVGRLLEAARGVVAADHGRLLVAVLADHGESLGEHGELTHGLFVYQSTLRVPFLLDGPGVSAGERRPGPARTADVMPTLLGRLGLAVPPGLDGRDLLEGEGAREAYAESAYPRTFGWAGLRSLRLRSLKLIDGARAELYDLQTDPAEANDLAPVRPHDVVRLRQALAAFRRSERKASRAPVDAESAERLRALGYVTPTGVDEGDAEDASRPDPRDRIQAYRAFEEAIWAEARGDRKQGLAALRRVVAADPHNPMFKRALATALRRGGWNAEAVALLDDLGSARDDAAVWHERALALAAAGRLREAEQSERRALELNPLLPEPHNHLGTLLAGRGLAGEALLRFEAASTLDPNNALAWSNRANALRALGRTQEAASDYRRAGALDPGNPDPWNGLGVLAVQAGGYEEAAALFRQSIARDPDHAEARLNLAVALVQLGEAKEALRELSPLLARRGEIADKARQLHAQIQ